MEYWIYDSTLLRYCEVYKNITDNTDKLLYLFLYIK